jgi:hypothetical protein
MKTGLPDMPCQMPDVASFGSSDLRMMMSCFGSMFFTTETISIVNFVGVLPANAVIP